MLEKQANPLTFLALYIASKVGATGLTVTVDVWEIQQDGTSTEIVTGGSATEVGDGIYRYVLSSGSVDANAEYLCVFKTANTSVDQQHLAAVYSVGRAGVANLDATVSSRGSAANLQLVDDLVDDLESRLTAGRATNLDNLNATISSRAAPGDAMDLVADALDATALAASAVSEIAAAISVTSFPAGAIDFTYTVTDSISGLPLEGVEVWISTDNPAVNIVWKGDTDAFGIALDVNGNLPALDAGTYYFWRQKAGYIFNDPDTEVVS